MGKLSSDISSIYNDYYPAFRNLYKVEIYPGSSDKITNSINNYIGLHATSISFNGESLTLDRNEVTKNFQLPNSGSPYQRTNELSITWREDENWKVKKYHDTWLGCLYDKDGDYFISYPLDDDKTVERETSSTSFSRNNTNDLLICRKDLYRIIYVYLPNHLGQYVDFIKFTEVLPKMSGGINLGWGASSEIITHQMSYYVKEWRWASVAEKNELIKNNGESL